MIKRTIFILAVLLLACVSISAQQSPDERGRSEAAQDVAEGKFVIKGWGLLEFKVNDIPTRTEVYEGLLLRKYKISFEWVAGCLIPDELLSYVTAYNEVSKAAIEAKFGKDVFEKTRKEADAEYEVKYAQKAREWDRQFKEALQKLPKKDN